jgi:hypothetical protein
MNYAKYAALCLLFVLSCNKNDPSFSGAKVKTVTNFIGGYIDTYTYNSDGNVVLVQRNLGDKTVYTYKGDTVIMQSINGASVTYSETDYVLHGQKCAAESFGKLQAQNSSAQYTYDANNQLTEQKNYGLSSLTSTVDYYIPNKNPTTVTTTLSNGTKSYLYMDYYTSNNNTIGTQDFGKGFLGYGSAYALKTVVHVGANNDTTDVVAYRYKYDGSSNIDTLVSYSRNGALVDSMAFTYY